jgi:Kef-type K+ transport system membrane component KefB
VEGHVLLMQIAAILIAARVFAEIAAAMDIPRVIGELCAGIVLGPSLLGWITPNEPIKLLAEIGIILLLFEVGLHTDLSRLVRARGGALRLALVGFIAPFLFGWLLSRHFFGLPNLVSLFIGGTLTATSIGVTIRILSDLGRDNSAEGQVVLGAAVIDDLLGVALLAVLYEFAVTGTVSLAQTGKVIIFVTLFFLLAPIAAKMLSLAIRRVHHLSEAPGLIPASLVALVLSFAAMAHVMGAPELLGGFAAGIALSRRFFLPMGLTFRVDPKFNRQIYDQMKPIIHLFTPIFFVMVGLSLDLSAVDWGSGFIWWFSLSIVFVAILGKLLGGVLVTGNPWARVAMGMAMVPRGEVGLIFAELGRVAGIFDDEVYAGMVIVIAYTTLLSPFWIKLYYRYFGWRFSRPPPANSPAPLPSDVD